MIFFFFCLIYLKQCTCEVPIGLTEETKLNVILNKIYLKTEEGRTKFANLLFSARVS